MIREFARACDEWVGRGGIGRVPPRCRSEVVVSSLLYKPFTIFLVRSGISLTS